MSKEVLRANVERWYEMHGAIFGRLGDALVDVAASAGGSIRDVERLGGQTPDGLSWMTGAADRLEHLALEAEALPANPAPALQTLLLRAARSMREAAQALREGSTAPNPVDQQSKTLAAVTESLGQVAEYMMAATAERDRLLGP